MGRLIVLSNRVKLPDNTPMAGGLAVALHDVLTQNCGIWMGWNGQIIDTNNSADANNFSSSTQSGLTPTLSTPTIGAATQSKHPNAKIRYHTTALSTRQYQHFYCGFANNVLWLLLHEQPDLIRQNPQDYSGYQAVNRLFAKQLNHIAKPDDVIWVHDYHFLSVAYYCRQLGMRNRIGFFLHIPFAPLPIWQQLDKSAELINHVAHYDVLGTQTQQDKTNCISVLQHYLKDCLLQDAPTLRVSNQQPFTSYQPSAKVALLVNLNTSYRHCITIDAYPIGVNVAKIQQQVSKLPTSTAAHQLKHSTHLIKPATQQIIAVDRIDYSKGLLQRFAAYRQFLQQYPTYQNQLKFLQIACPSRLDLPVYQQLYTKVRQAVSTINRQFIGKGSHSQVDNLIMMNTDKSVNRFASNVNASAVYSTGFMASTLQNHDIDSDDSTKNVFTSYDLNSIELDNIDLNSFDLNSFDLDSFDLNSNAFNADNFEAPRKLGHWQPITYSENVLNHAALMRAFWYSDVGWVNSLKDGMNLVAKEYIAAQNPNNPGVLLLSRYAGASEQMQAAVIIDPHQPNSIIEGLETALTMPLEERISRHQTLLQGLQQYDLKVWQQTFLTDLYAVKTSCITRLYTNPVEIVD